ncbi:putative 2OG-Fe(II) oxygenase [Alteromonas oceanisediminis]|uniref:putative 2OG-Fe(II) oxygenase n=1 Tax=Alteromonas oceanisediminis TaxID=2836180 RepID=UPI001BDAC01B|nr:putative 2OG-Fe(II) oxygenase [Alteromonas oceanisediminis]MBT0584859.1 DUF3808 domain-containing protein [Alteromonas oceanisediminis]
MNPSLLTQQLMQAYRGKQYEQVIQLFSQHTNLATCDPGSGLCFLGALRFTGRVEKAQTGYVKLLRRFPNAPPILNSYGNALVDNGDTSLAIRQFKQALRIDANFVDALINLGRVQAIQKQYELALKSYQNADRIKPNNMLIRLGIADAMRELGNNQRALAIYSELLQQPSGLQNPRLVLNMVKSYRVQQDYPAAITLLTSAIAVQPGNAELHSTVAAMYALVKSFEQSRQHYLSALELAPDNINVHVEYAHFAWQQNDAEAFTPLVNALHAQEHHQALWQAALNLLLNAEQYELVRPLTEKARSLFPQSSPMYLYSARLARLSGNLKEAQAYIEQAMQREGKPSSSVIENERGYIALASSDGKHAETIYRRLIQREPDNQGWWTLLSTAIKLQNKHEDYVRLCDYRQVFCASIVNDRPTDFLPALVAKLDELHSDTQHPIGQSLRNGSQTFEDIFDDPDPTIQSLKDWISATATAFVAAQQRDKKHPFLVHAQKQPRYTGSWSVNLRCGGFHTSHFHPQGWLSGVFYVDVPSAVDEGGEGWLQFGRPEIEQLSLDADYAIKPQAGMLALFPSFMWHGTRAFTQQGRRLTIAFDMIPSK